VLLVVPRKENGPMANSPSRPCREVGETVIARIEADGALSSWLSTRCDTWGLEEGLLKRRLASLLFVVCYSLAADASSGAASHHSVLDIADALERRTTVELFTPVRSASDYADLHDVQELWLISTQITPVQALYWSRLMHVAAEILTKICAQRG
jgi:hypothetical protein